MIRFGVFAALLLSTASARPAGEDNGASKSSMSKRATSFWYANMDHDGDYRGKAPDIDDDAYSVYVAVTAGDGSSIQDAINSASNGASRNGQWLASQPRVSSKRQLDANLGRLTG